GWDNFQYLFGRSDTLQIIRNTFILSVLSILVGFPFPIMAAILLNEIGRGWYKRTIQTLMYLPHCFSWVIVGGIVVTVFALDGGIVNSMLGALVGTRFAFLYQAFSWVGVYLGSGIWKEAGFSAIIFLAALSS